MMYALVHHVGLLRLCFAGYLEFLLLTESSRNPLCIQKVSQFFVDRSVSVASSAKKLTLCPI